MGDPAADMRAIFSNISLKTKQSISAAQMQHLGEFAVNLVVKRTRLGSGVVSANRDKFTLSALSPNYIKARGRFAGLSSTTTPSKSNLTRTGQMLASVQVLTVKDGSVTFGPQGARSDSSFTNDQIAAFQAAKGRPFNNVSRLESQQILREFRRTFGDLLNNSTII